MKIAILQCDDVLDKFQQEFGNYPDMVANLLRAVEANVEIEVFDVRKAQLPQKLDHWDLFITTGSKASVMDNEPWIDCFIDFVKKLDRAQKKLIGICFGHQIIALAKGGTVEKSDKGWGVGIATNTILQKKEWMGNQVDELNIIVSHQDQVINLPTEAEILASTDFCPNFMVQWNRHFLSVQGHPEWSNNYSKALINHRRQIIPDQRVILGLASLEKMPDNNLFAQWILNFTNN